MPPNKKKELVRFRPRLQDERRQQNRFTAKEWASKLAESDKGSYYNQEKWLKDDKASEKPIETTAKSSFVEFKNYKIALLHSKVTTISIYPYLGQLKSNLSSSPFFNSSFIYLPTGIWETTRSGNSCRGYFQISFPFPGKNITSSKKNTRMLENNDLRLLTLASDHKITSTSSRWNPKTQR